MNDCTQRCPTCPNKFNLVLADGPTDARILAIGEAPGKDEDRLGHPFSGQAGKEYNDNYLGLAGLHRSEIRQTNVMRCRPDQNKKPNKTEAEGCVQWHLPTELEQVRPEVVILLGATAVNTLCPDVDLESQHGIPFRGVVMGWECWIVPMWHPASGLHNTTMMVPMLEDWTNFGLWWNNLDWTGETGYDSWQWGVDQFPNGRDYRLAYGAGSVELYFRQYPYEEYFSVDTESHDGVDWSIQITTKVGTGIMILMTDLEALEELSAWLREAFICWSKVAFHHAESDKEQLERLVVGVDFEYVDTMQLAYHLQNLPQGLKSLSFRLLGRKRKSWQEVVGQYSRQALVEWMFQAKFIAEDRLRYVIPQISEKTGKPIKPKVVKSPLESFFNRVIQHTTKPQGAKPYDPWEQLNELVCEDLNMVVDELGPWPKLGIANCPLDVARDYGCSDSDDTLDLVGVLKGLVKKAEAEWNVQEGDIDQPRVESLSGVNLAGNLR